MWVGPFFPPKDARSIVLAVQVFSSDRRLFPSSFFFTISRRGVLWLNVSWAAKTKYLKIPGRKINNVFFSNFPPKWNDSSCIYVCCRSSNMKEKSCFDLFFGRNAVSFVVTSWPGLPLFSQAQRNNSIVNFERFYIGIHRVVLVTL